MATGGATAAPLGIVERTGRPDSAGARSVLLVRDADRTTTSLRARDDERLSVEPLADAASLVRERFEPIAVVRAESAGFARFALLARVGGRAREVATFGPVASSEEARATLVVVPGSAHAGAGNAPRIGVAVRMNDSCGLHEAIVDLRTVDTTRGTSSPSAAMEPWPAHEVRLETSLATPEELAGASAAHLVVDGALTRAGSVREGLESLVDADAGTSFPGNGAPGRVAIRWALAPIRIRALVLDVIPGPEGADVRVRAGAMRATLHLPSSDGSAVVRFAEPLELRCMEIELGTHPTSARALRRIAVIPEVAESAAPERLVTELASEGARSDLAMAALVRLGAVTLPALESAFEDGTTQERRRILRAAEAMVLRAPNVLRLFVRAVESEDEALRSFAIARCLAMGAPGHRALVVALRRGDTSIAMTLAEHTPDVAFDPIFERLALTELDSERRTLHAALVKATRMSPIRGRQALRRFVEGESNELARAVALAAMVDTQDRDGIPASLSAFWASTATSDAVAVRVRWLEAIAAVPPLGWTEAMDEHVRLGFTSEAWMVREAAVRAAASATRPETHAALVACLDDPYPRVRAAAIAALAHDQSARRRLGELSRRDAWPIVRAAALAGLVDVPEAEPLLRDALTDRSTRVREELLAALAARRDARFSADALGIVERNRAPASVVVAAIRYLAAVCMRGAEAVLVAAVERALSEQSERNRATGVAAAHALEQLGNADAIATARRLVDPSVHGAAAPSRCSP